MLDTQVLCPAQHQNRGRWLRKQRMCQPLSVGRSSNWKRCDLCVSVRIKRRIDYKFTIGHGPDDQNIFGFITAVIPPANKPSITYRRDLSEEVRLRAGQT